MRGTTGNDFELAELLKLAKSAHEVPAIPITKCRARLMETVVVKPRQIMKRLIPLRPLDFFFSQLNELGEMPDVALLQ